MEERQITVAGTTHKMPPLFMVLATQNPIEQEGTYPLPEAQMDRFIMKVMIEYPDEESEAKVVRLVRGEEIPKSQTKQSSPNKEPISQQVIFDARQEIHQIHVSENLEKYIVDLINATRFPDRYGEPISKWIQVGASPRGAISLDKVSRAQAWLAERDHVTPDDVRMMIQDVLRHRIILSYEANAEGITPDQVIAELVKLVAVA
jgi:MoxR-like ATPase